MLFPFQKEINTEEIALKWLLLDFGAKKKVRDKSFMGFKAVTRSKEGPREHVRHVAAPPDSFMQKKKTKREKTETQGEIWAPQSKIPTACGACCIPETSGRSHQKGSEVSWANVSLFRWGPPHAALRAGGRS